MRIIVGAVLLVQAQVFWTYRDIFLNPAGPLPWSISDTWVDPLLPKLSDVVSLFSALGMGAEAAVATVLALHAVAAAFLMVGYRTRLSTVVAWATFVVLKNSMLAYTYGIGAMLLIALFYSLFMPTGREWSVDRALNPRRPAPAAGDASLCVLVFRLHLCIVYAAAGFSKVVGEQWWSGDALWRALSLPQFRQFDPSPLLAWPGLLVTASLVAIFSQLAYPVLVWTRLRAFIVVVTELMHLGIAIFLGLWLFSATMIALNTAAFGEAVWAALSGRRRTGDRAPAARAASLRVVYDGACPFCDDYVRYQRLQAAADRLELVDARSHPEVLAEHSIASKDLEDGMVVIVDGQLHRGADAVHLLSQLSEAPQRAWVRTIAAVTRSRPIAHLVYPVMRLGRRIALAFLGVPRFPRG
jgi:predicted DCC family thiol-disulfide oxidoreductase YuxK